MLFKNIPKIVLILVFSLEIVQAQLEYNHEFPIAGSNVSGVGTLLGWVCDAQSVNIQIDDFPEFNAVYGNERADTFANCGDNNNGYSQLINWNLFGSGIHRIQVRVDGQLIDDSTFRITALSDGFLEGVKETHFVLDFPAQGDLSALAWNQTEQNFSLINQSISRPSSGNGFTEKGQLTRTIDVPQVGSQEFYMYVPTGYVESKPFPIIYALHGAGGPGSASNAARQVRDTWSELAEKNGLIVVAPQATGSQGGWIPSNISRSLDAISNDLNASFNIELTRRYLWGFSAGAYVAHWLALNHPEDYAAYATSAGLLEPLAGINAPQSASLTRRIPVILSHGTQDSSYNLGLSNKQIFINNAWIEPFELSWISFNGGHTYSAEHLKNIWLVMEHHMLPAN